MININEYFKERDPFWFTLIYLSVLIAFVITVIFYPGIREKAHGYFQAISLFLTLGPIILTTYHALNYKTTVTSISRLVSLYMQVVLMFGCIHFLSVAAHIVPQFEKQEYGLDREKTVPSSAEKRSYTTNINGINGQWLVMLDRNESCKKIIIREALKSLFDSMYFSLMTSSTVGYGDMHPKTFWTKLIVMLQVLVSIFIAAFGAGSFFARNENVESETTGKK